MTETTYVPIYDHGFGYGSLELPTELYDQFGLNINSDCFVTYPKTISLKNGQERDINPISFMVSPRLASELTSN